MTSTGRRWIAHDIVAGVLGGGTTGAIAGLVLTARVFSTDTPWGFFGGAGLGAVLGVLMLLGSHRESERFLTVTVVVMWILAVASGAFLYLLYDAIRSFQ